MATRGAATARATSRLRAPRSPSRCYERFCARLGAQRGVFGAAMAVELVNDGPVTLMVESPAGGGGSG